MDNKSTRFIDISHITSKYATKFKQTSTLKKILITGTAMTAGSLFYTFSSYYFSQMWYNSLPYIHYNITGDIKNNAGILFFIHGWPDTSSLWNPQVKYLSQHNYCCITLELPNFNLDSPMQNPWGYDLMQVVNAMANTIQKILNKNNAQNDGIILITHDWGSYLGELLYIHYKNVIKMNKLVLLDVGDGVRDKKEEYKYSYQFVNAIMFLMPQTIGTWYLKRYYNKMLRKRGIILPAMRDNNKLDSCQCYLYFYIIKTIFFGNKNAKDKVNVGGKLDEFEGLPILFVDATKGWLYPEIRYYSHKFRKWLEDREDCEFVEFDCYHWIQDEEIGLPQKLNVTIHEFIEKKEHVNNLICDESRIVSV